MKVLVSGGTGFIGSALIRSLGASGHEVSLLTRRPISSFPPARHVYQWDPGVGRIDRAAFQDCGAVVHVAGESLAAARWSKKRKREIVDSRVLSTGLLAEAIGGEATPPRVLVSASAVGYYGDRGEELLTEESGSGRGFLAEVCAAWEAALAPAARRGVRVVIARIGVVLGPGGGALAKMLLPFRLGVGGPLGNGRQWMSWIALEDLLSALTFAMAREDLSGPINVVAPEPVRSRDFARVLGRVLERPAVLSVPALALRLLFGEMADEALLSSARAVPAKLTAAGFGFSHARLERALRWALDREGVEVARTGA